MKADQENSLSKSRDAVPSAPLTLEGYAILHQMFRIRRTKWRSADSKERASIIAEAEAALSAMAPGSDGESAAFSVLGHKSDLLLIHFRRGFDELGEVEQEIGALALSDFLEPVTSYLSMIEIGLYEATVAMHTRLDRENIRPRTPEWSQAVAAELSAQRQKLGTRLYPKIPARRYLCFYPMDKKREGDDNWYRLPIEERRRLMHEHGMVGRRFAGEVTQIISGSIGFDDFEWGVDLFADDPLVFKKLIYEMRFDEASAGYAKFGPFYVGIRTEAQELGELMPA